MEGKINAKIVTAGFEPNEIRPRKMWTRLQEDFLELYNDYCDISNQRIPMLNQAWQDMKKPEEEETKKELTPEEQEIKDLHDRIEMWEYGCYMRDHFDLCAFEANRKHPDCYLSGFILMSGDLPVFGARIKQHPELYMTFVIEK